MKRLALALLTVVAAIVAFSAWEFNERISAHEELVNEVAPTYFRMIVPLAFLIVTLVILGLTSGYTKFRIAVGVIAAITFLLTLMGNYSGTGSIGGGLLWILGQAMHVPVAVLLILLFVLPWINRASSRSAAPDSVDSRKNAIH